MSIEKEILDYYDSKSEKDRLSHQSLEKLRTQELILSMLPPAPCKIADIGGGAGVYAFWLQQLGYEVHLVDATPKHIEEAKEQAKTINVSLASMNVGDARQLDFADNEFDAVLLLGPLYHLTERSDRLQALSETWRILKPEGIVAAVGISRYASMMDGFYLNLVEDPAFVKIMNHDLIDGQHRNHEGKKYFTTAFFHLPDELLFEITEANFQNAQLYAIESFGDYIPSLLDKWQNEDFRKTLLETLRKVESDPAIIGMSPHIMAVGRKGRSDWHC